MKHLLRIAKLAASTAALAMGIGLAAAPERVLAQEAVFVMGSNEVGAPTYNPIKGTLLNVATTLIYDTLVIQDADQSYHPHLAESWESSADGMSWTFKLRQGVTFHDGEPFNAETIAWWVSQYAGTDNEFMVAAIEKVEVIDDHTVRFVMSRPEPNLLYNLSSVFMGIPSSA